MNAKQLRDVGKLIEVLHEVANPSCENPEAAKAIWEAVRVALERRGMNYASIIAGGVSVDLALEKMEQTNEA
jgi:hypothetical protein